VGLSWTKRRCWEVVTVSRNGNSSSLLSLCGLFDHFLSSIAQRDAARKRFEEKRNGAREESVSAARERATAMRAKDKATMDMFQQLAKQRFG
jgi:hypothetical protein